MQLDTREGPENLQNPDPITLPRSRYVPLTPSALLSRWLFGCFTHAVLVFTVLVFTVLSPHRPKPHEDHRHVMDDVDFVNQALASAGECVAGWARRAWGGKVCRTKGEGGRFWVPFKAEKLPGLSSELSGTLDLVYLSLIFVQHQKVATNSRYLDQFTMIEVARPHTTVSPIPTVVRTFQNPPTLAYQHVTFPVANLASS